jgi:hypothetical protein
MTNLAQMGALNCVYFAMLAMGVMYSVVILVAGEVHDFGMHVDVPGGGFDALHGEVSVISLSPITLAGFVTAFGAFGLIATGLFNASSAMSLVWASLGGLVVGLVSHALFIWIFIKPQGSSEYTRHDVVGSAAEVITPIPAGGVGEIAFVAQGARVTMTARTSDGLALPRGRLVEIDRVVGSVAFVTREGESTAGAAPSETAGGAPT